METLDLVNGFDQVVAQSERADYEQLTGVWIRSVSVFLQRGNGDLWIPTRSLDKKLFPGCLDSSACGHVRAGESYLEAAIRETAEETGIQFDSGRIRHVTTLSPLKDGTFCFSALFQIVVFDEQPCANSEDHLTVEWMAPHQLRTLIEAGLPVRSDLPLLLQSFEKMAAGCGL